MTSESASKEVVPDFLLNFLANDEYNRATDSGSTGTDLLIVTKTGDVRGVSFSETDMHEEELAVGEKTAEELLKWARAKARRITVEDRIDGNTAIFENMGLDLDDVETMASSVGLEAEDLLLIPTHVSVGSTDSGKDTDDAAEHSNEVGEDQKLIAEIRRMLDQHARTSTRKALSREKDQIEDIAQDIDTDEEGLAYSVATALPYSGSPSRADSQQNVITKVDLGSIEAKLDVIRDLVLEQRDTKLQKEWYTVDEAACLTGFQPYTIRQCCNTGRIRNEWRDKHYRRGVWRIHREAIEWIRNHGLPPVN